MKGVFITFEGTEGCGKSTQITLLAERLRALGRIVQLLREPGGTPIGEEIRHTLKHSQVNEAMTPEAELLLMNASRAQLVREVIRPALARGEIVLSDRFYDSTIAYQGYGHQQDLDQVRALVKYATGGLVPDLTVLLDVDIEEGLRSKKKDNEWNRLDAYTVEFHQRVRAGYLQMVKAEPNRWVVVDAGQKWEAVQDQLRMAVLGRLQKK